MKFQEDSKCVGLKPPAVQRTGLNRLLRKRYLLLQEAGKQKSDLTRQKSNLVTQAGYQCDTNHNDNFLQVMGTHNVYRWPKWLKEHVLFWSASPRDMVL